jgi:hypothetical protein
MRDYLGGASQRSSNWRILSGCIHVLRLHGRLSGIVPGDEGRAERLRLKGLHCCALHESV